MTSEFCRYHKIYLSNLCRKILIKSYLWIKIYEEMKQYIKVSNHETAWISTTWCQKREEFEFYSSTFCWGFGGCVISWHQFQFFFPFISFIIFQYFLFKSIIFKKLNEKEEDKYCLEIKDILCMKLSKYSSMYIFKMTS